MPLPVRTSRLYRHPLIGAVFALLLITLTFSGIVAPSGAVASVTKVVFIRNSNTNPAMPFEAFDAVSMAAVDLNGDGVKEILAHNDNNRFYVFNGATGALIAELQTKHPQQWGARVLAGPAIGDLNGNGRPDIVLTNSAGWVTAFEARTTSTPPFLAFDRLWEYWLDPHNENPNYAQEMPYGNWNGFPGLDGPVHLADPNGDGKDQIYVQLDGMPGLYRLGPTGNVEWWEHSSDGNAGPLVADLDGDGTLEAIYPSDGGKLIIYNARTMSHRCTFHAQGQGAWPASISVSPTVADITGNGRKEIVFGVRNVYPDQSDPNWIERSHAMHFAVRHDCTLLWKKTWDWGNPHVHMHPVPLDVTGNGVLDVVFQDWNTIGHKPGNWQSTGPANVYAVRGTNGDLLWRVETVTYWSNKNLAVADITGNGAVEILVNRDQGGNDGIGLYSRSGSAVGFIEGRSGWQVTRGPLVADLNGNGKLDIVLPLHRSANFCSIPKDVGCREGGLQIYHTTSTAQPLYGNNHALNAGRGDAGGAFAPVFTNVRGNNWWVETEVRADRALQAVHARVDGGSWRSLARTDWNSWAASFHVPNDSIVQFRATATDGAAALSGCYRWTSATPTPCPSAAFEPRFVNVRGNNWWVETEVESDRAVQAVHARVDGGSWRSLSRTDWNSWAASIHVPTNSIVQFRATATDGATGLSGCYRWTSATPTSCPGSGFEARFTNVRGNNWWVETNVEADRSVAAVHARVDGGSWRALSATDWGSWATSLHAPTGSQVQFRATAADGATATSSSYTWPP